MLPAAVFSASASTVRVFRGSIQSSSSRCVRFAVADDPATLAPARTLPPTLSTGWIAQPSPGAREYFSRGPAGVLTPAGLRLGGHLAESAMARIRHNRTAPSWAQWSGACPQIHPRKLGTTRFARDL